VIGAGRRLWLALLLTAATAPEPARGDSFDPVLLRLTRIARGEWLMADRRAVRLPYAGEIRLVSRRHGLSPSLLAALVRAESNFNPYAISHAGAQGLGQLMPRTARQLGVSDPFDPLQNLDGSARYLSRQLNRFDSVSLALAAYHAGPARVTHDRDGLPKETRKYVTRVMRFERDYRRRGIP
jgi:soluble lytic murein transglycosylase-like protein